MNEISLQYPSWFIIFCLLLGAAYAGFLYFRSQTFRNSSKNQVLLIGLSSLRFVVVSFIAFLLLSPLVRTTFTDEEKPVVVLLHDNTGSIPLGNSEMDSVAYQNELNDLIRELESSYEVKTYTFDQNLNDRWDLDFSGQATNISNAINELSNRYINQNLGAVIFASDGIFNQGNNPVYNLPQINAPFFTIALGDTVAQRDIKIQQVLHNRIVYSGDKFAIQVHFAGVHAEGERSDLLVQRIRANSAPVEVFRKNIGFTRDDVIMEEQVIIDADQPGLQQYRVHLTPIDNEITLENNTHDFFIEVLDGRQKILILGNSPHPDITAIRQALDRNKNYEIETAFIEEFNRTIAPYDLVILHQLPSVRQPATQVLSQINDLKKPVLFINGKQTAYPLFNQAQDVITVNNNRRTFNEARGELNQAFSIFNPPNNLAPNVLRFPPLYVPFGETSVNASANVLMTQRIGSVSTNYPLISFQQSGDARTGVINGEGIWRWRLHDFQLNNNHNLFDELISRVVQYLSVKTDTRRFRVNTPKNIFYENEPVTFNAELYNESFELINTPDVSLTIYNEEESEFPFQFTRTGNGYMLHAGQLPVGNYTYKAITNFNNRHFTYEGVFSINSLNLEALETTANHQLLYQMSELTGGQMFYPSQVSHIFQVIRSRENVRPVLHESYRTNSVINLKWVFFLILILLSAEWFIRKVNGAY